MLLSHQPDVKPVSDQTLFVWERLDPLVFVGVPTLVGNQADTHKGVAKIQKLGWISHADNLVLAKRKQEGESMRQTAIWISRFRTLLLAAMRGS